MALSAAQRGELADAIEESRSMQLVELLSDPDAALLRKAYKVRRSRGFEAGLALRSALLEHIGPLAEPGLKLGLLTLALQTFVASIDWTAAAEALDGK